MFSYLHEADAAGQEVHEEGEERGHVVDLRRLRDATQRLQRGDNLLFDGLLLADLSEVLLVDEVEETLLQRVKNLGGQKQDNVSEISSKLSPNILKKSGEFQWQSSLYSAASNAFNRSIFLITVNPSSRTKKKP